MSEPRRPAGAVSPIDRGMCLSMHQPWASLLVYGIKRIEGRGWTSDHRGRLWIAATAKQPSPQEVEELEAFYRSVHAADAEGAAPGISADLQFPPAYPAGVLLGSVEVVDVVSAEQVEAWEGLPGGLKAEAGSPQCFLCEGAQQLVVPQQIRGQHKIFLLEKKLHKVALLGLKPAPNSQGFRWVAWGPPPPPHGLVPSQNKHKFLEQQKEKEGRERGGGGGKAPKTGGCQSPQMAALEHQQQQAWEEQQVQQQQQDPAKRLRSVQKKLRQIAALEEKQRAGQALSPEEAAKLAQRQQVEAEGAQLAGQVHRV